MKAKRFSKAITLCLAIFMALNLCGCGRNDTAADNPGKEERVVAAEVQTPEKPEKGDKAEEASTRTVTDMLGREVEIPTEINTIICNGSNALRMVSYLRATGLMVGVEETDKGYETSTKRDYAYACYDIFKDMPVIGKGGGRSKKEAEQQAAREALELMGY